MLVGFHFDEDFLSCDDITSTHSTALNLSILEFWHERGCFIFPYSHIQKYKDWIKFIPTKHILRWEASLSKNLIFDMGSTYKKTDGYINITALKEDCLKSGVDLVLVSDVFDKLGLSTEVEMFTDDVDLCKASSFTIAPSVIKSKLISNKGILPGDEINDIWNEQFRKTAAYSKTITIIDRYFISNLYDDMNKKKTSLEKFIELLSGVNKKFNINIISSGDIKDSPQHIAIEKYVRELLKKGTVSACVSSLTIGSCNDALFRDDSHERYICFDKFVYKIDKGMQIFSPYPQVAASISIYRNSMGSTFTHAYKVLMPKRLWVVT